MLDILKFTFESYSHFWGVVLLLWLMGGGISWWCRIIAASIANGVADVRKEKP